jgi:hypothetical protein
MMCSVTGFIITIDCQCELKDTSHITNEAVIKLPLILLSDPSYNPDLAPPSDFCLFRHLKKAL